MDVVFMHNYHDAEKYRIECPIKSIMIGPGGSQESVFNSVVHRLEYGVAKVWRYTDEELEKLLSEFVYGCFMQYRDQIKDDWYSEIASEIVEQWCGELGYQYQLLEATKIGVEVKLSKGKIIRSVKTWENDTKKQEIINNF